MVEERHIIRLRGPWRYQPLARRVLLADGTVREDVVAQDAARTMRLPADWSQVLGDFRGRVRFMRSFHRPTGLTPGTHVALVIDAVDARATVMLNGQLLGTCGGPGFAARFNIRPHLQLRNELAIDVELPYELASDARFARPPGRESASGGGLVGDVYLEISGVAV
jgi:hypothetical protein